MAKLNSVVSALISNDKSVLAAAFSSVSMDDMKSVRNNFNAFYSEFKASVEAAETAKAEKLAAIQKETQDLIDNLVLAGLDLKLASESAAAKMASKYPETVTPVSSGKSWSFETVTVVLDGETLEIGTKGNKGSQKALKAAKEAIEAGTYKDRAEWIAAHQPAVETDAE